MWLERDIDCLMARTRNRPLPMHRLAPRTALVFGGLQGALSLPALAMVNLLTAALGLSRWCSTSGSTRAEAALALGDLDRRCPRRAARAMG
jgi:heme O synthase-like polyprenyltransferase